MEENEHNLSSLSIWYKMYTCGVEIWVGGEFHLDHHLDWMDLITLIFGGHSIKQSKGKVLENGSAELGCGYYLFYAMYIKDNFLFL